MKLTNKEELSRWAYKQCKHINDTPEMRNLITTCEWAFYYCYNIKDIKEMWVKIKRSNWAYWYCFYVEDREEVRKYIKDRYNLKILKSRRKMHKK